MGYSEQKVKGMVRTTLVQENDHISYYVIWGLMENNNNSNLFLHMFHSTTIIFPKWIT